MTQREVDSMKAELKAHGSQIHEVMEMVMTLQHETKQDAASISSLKKKGAYNRHDLNTVDTRVKKVDDKLEGFKGA